jgi:hypothetical protein
MALPLTGVYQCVKFKSNSFNIVPSYSQNLDGTMNPEIQLEVTEWLTGQEHQCTFMKNFL